MYINYTDLIGPAYRKYDFEQRVFRFPDRSLHNRGRLYVPKRNAVRNLVLWRFPEARDSKWSIIFLKKKSDLKYRFHEILYASS